MILQARLLPQILFKNEKKREHKLITAFSFTVWLIPDYVRFAKKIDMCASDSKKSPTSVFRRCPREKLCGTSRARARVDVFFRAARYLAAVIARLFASGTKGCAITTPREATRHATGNTWFSTDGGRHTDGKDEQTAPRRTRRLQSLPRRWRCTWKRVRVSAEKGGFRLVHHHRHQQGGYYGRKGCLFLYLRGRAYTRIMHVAGVGRGERDARLDTHACSLAPRRATLLPTTPSLPLPRNRMERYASAE